MRRTIQFHLGAQVVSVSGLCCSEKTSLLDKDNQQMTCKQNEASGNAPSK